MVSEHFKRKLAAILSADVEGYSRLMGLDEESTIRTLTKYRSAMTTLIQQHRGRVVDTPGDNLLAEFASVVDAVNCAVEIQRELAERNAKLPDERKMLFRIGINLGDVVDEEDRIYGDGVNITARLESLAEAGGICISGTAYDQVETKLDLEYKYIGEQEVKNIAKPVRAYRVLSYPGAAAHRVIRAKKAIAGKIRKAALALAAVLLIAVIAVVIWNIYLRPSTPSIKAASAERMAFPLPDKPSIAVLPFVNMSEDPKQEYFSDGMTDDLITDLSKLKGLLVIARNSTFTYKGKSVKVQQVAEELGVRYVVEGSVRRDREQVRINVQLIEAATGHHLWAERYDGKMADIFALQDQINQKIISTLEVKLTAFEKSRIARKETNNIQAYDAFLRGWEHYKQMTPNDFSKASAYFKEAINLDPIYARAYAALALLYLRALDIGWHRWVTGTHFVQARLDARKYVKMAMKDPSSLAYQATALTLIFKRLYPEAINAAEKALTLGPNDAYNFFILAKILNYAGKSEKAINFTKRAMRLDPQYPADYLIVLGESNFALGNLEEAAIYLEKAQTHYPQNRPNMTLLESLIATYSHLGRNEEAQVLFESLKKVLYPPISLRRRMNFHPYNSPEVTDRLAQGLIKAGMPEEAYYTVSDEDRLRGDKIRTLVFGRTMQSLEPMYGIERWYEIAKDGEATRPNNIGRFWIDNDMLCYQWQKLKSGLSEGGCVPVFKNPSGSQERSDEYLLINEWGMSPFTMVD
jgi:TolB-like protein/class 3 adenylate cyclase/Flp pilus assembly protein TadD